MSTVTIQLEVSINCFQTTEEEIVYGTLSSTYQKIAGSNRLNADSSAKGYSNLSIGKDDSKVTPDSSKARYNHWSNLRPTGGNLK